MPWFFSPFTGTLDYYQTSTTTFNFANGEVPTGATDGANTSFLLAHAPDLKILMVDYNGTQLYLNEDYTLVGSTITTTSFIPEAGTKIRVSYTY